MTFSFLISREKRACNAHIMEDKHLKKTIPELQKELNHTDELIHKKTVLHGEYWPIPFRSCRQNLRDDLAELKKRNTEVGIQLAEAQDKHKQIFEGLLKCAREGIIVPPNS